jgi:fructose-bisphosphate aldolase class 1
LAAATSLMLRAKK